MRQRKRKRNSTLAEVCLSGLAFCLSLCLVEAQQVPLQLNQQLKGPPESQFQVFESRADFLLLGSRNLILNISLINFSEVNRIEWAPSADDQRLCRLKGKSELQCQNYIRVLKLPPGKQDELFVCGTNAYKPLCRRYKIDSSNKYKLLNESQGDGRCPSLESQPVAALFVGDELYTATRAQFSGSDALIYREPLRTEQFNTRQLNAPTFISAFQYESHVYFLFREPLTEQAAASCGPRVLSRIGRVCIHDQGDNRKQWNTFAKARLNCSLPGEYPFYFDELQAVSQVIYKSGKAQLTHPKADLFYAAFGTPANSLGGSAICAFRMSDVLNAFESPYLTDALQAFNSVSLPASPELMMQQTPASNFQAQRDACDRCAPATARCSPEAFNHLRENPLLEPALNSLWSQPLISMASLNFRLSQLIVDVQVAPGQPRSDIIFAATTDGRVLKLVNMHPFEWASSRALSAQVHPNFIGWPLSSTLTGAGEFSIGATKTLNSPDASVVASTLNRSTLFVDELSIFDSRTPIVHLSLYRSPLDQSGSTWLVAVASNQVKAIQISRCERANSCVQQRPQSRDIGGANVPSTTITPAPSHPAPINPSAAPIAAPFGLMVHTSENFYFAVILCALCGLLLGLFIGYVLPKRDRRKGASICSSNESNLYMASTGSHNGNNNLFYSSQQHLTQSSQHPAQLTPHVIAPHHAQPPPLPAPNNPLATSQHQQVHHHPPPQNLNANLGLSQNHNIRHPIQPQLHHRTTKLPTIIQTHQAQSQQVQQQPVAAQIFNMSPNFPS